MISAGWRRGLSGGIAVAVVAVAALLGGCGSARARRPQSPGEVIRAWSTALRQGNVEGAARYFALPSEMINTTETPGELSVIKIHTVAQARAANETLPCGARLISVAQHGRYTSALFRLTGRAGPGGSTCNPGAGQTARTNFVIADGLIVQWIRAPDVPQNTPLPPTPAGPSGSGTSTV